MGPDLARWWPSTYCEVVEMEPGDGEGIGSVHRLRARGGCRTPSDPPPGSVEARHPNGFTLDAWGDLAGRGEWSFSQDGEFVDITYDWRIRAEKPLLRLLSPLVKPVLRSNHTWTMNRGEESLKLELLGRRLPGAALPPPPSPYALPVRRLAAVSLLLAGAAALGYVDRKANTNMRRCQSKCEGGGRTGRS